MQGLPIASIIVRFGVTLFYKILNVKLAQGFRVSGFRVNPTKRELQWRLQAGFMKEDPGAPTIIIVIQYCLSGGYIGTLCHD